MLQHVTEYIDVLVCFDTTTAEKQKKLKYDACFIVSSSEKKKKKPTWIYN